MSWLSRLSLCRPGCAIHKSLRTSLDAEHETTYPSTFLIDREGSIFFVKIVKEHGGRTKAEEILDAMPKPKLLSK